LGGYVAVEYTAKQPTGIAEIVVSGASTDYRGVLGVTTRLARLPNPVERGFIESEVERFAPVRSVGRCESGTISRVVLTPSQKPLLIWAILMNRMTRLGTERT
jgi:hypothetical protein